MIFKYIPSLFSLI